MSNHRNPSVSEGNMRKPDVIIGAASLNFATKWRRPGDRFNGGFALNLTMGVGYVALLERFLFLLFILKAGAIFPM